jgi:ADP-ribosylglycohydrolase/fructose-1,6-bisphosphatase/inositol monophosphatase family enzyme
MELTRALAVAEECARAAGELLRADFHRPGGPRGGGDKAEADTEAERLIRGRLLAAFPGFWYLGEETGREAGSPGAPVWLVDPNDGTRDYLVGRRGSAVSIGLVAEGRPVLGVVFAFGYPDDRGTLVTWAEGLGPVRRDGAAVTVTPPPALTVADVVLVSSKGDRDPAGNLRCAHPARYRTLPSIAHRLALVAAGEAAATSSLFSPCGWDYAGGHALLRGAGGTLVDQDGREVAYTGSGESSARSAYGGSREVAALLARRPWDAIGAGPWGDPRPAHLERGRAVADAGLLSRAQGCLMGQAAGDSLGALVEFASAAEIAAAGPGPSELADGGHWNILAGQPTDDTEMALALARSIVAAGGPDPAAAFAAYEAWGASGPFDMGHTTRSALSGRPIAKSQANGSLMRASPLAVYAHAARVEDAARIARADSALTHPHPVGGDAAAAFVIAGAHAIRTGAGAAAYDEALRWARAHADPAVTGALEAAGGAAPVCDGENIGWVLIALRNAFHELLHARSVEEGVVRTVRRGGDTDTNAAIAGALLGAVHGREAVPAQWRRMVLSCRPLAPAARRPRPMPCWPVDLYELAERLLLAGDDGKPRTARVGRDPERPYQRGGLANPSPRSRSRNRSRVQCGWGRMPSARSADAYS